LPTTEVGVPQASLASALATSVRIAGVQLFVVEVADEAFGVHVEIGGVPDDVVQL
jgi:hypothetical protein